MKKIILMLALAIMLLSTVNAYNYNCSWVSFSHFGAAMLWDNLFDYNTTTGDCKWETASTRLTACGFIDMGAGEQGYTYPPSDYSNGTLYSVIYARDDAANANNGYFYSVIPKAYLPPNPSTRVWLASSHYWSAGPCGIIGRSNRTTMTLWAQGGSTFQVRRTFNGSAINGGNDDSTVTPLYGAAIYWDACDFSCATWGTCQPTDTKGCIASTDGNGTGHCPVTSLGNTPAPDWYGNTLISYDVTSTISEFGTQACDYCTPRWNCVNYAPDCSVPGTEFQNCTQVEDLDNCYGQTGLASDLYTGDYSEFTRSCYQGGQPEAPKEEPVPLIPEPQPQPLPEPLVPIEVITCNPGVEYVYQTEQKVITTFRDIEVPYIVRESVGETTCGIDADGDGNKCDLNEDFVSCGTDCKIQFTEVICLDPYRCMLTESWFLQIVLLLELLVSTYLLYTIFMG